MLKTIKNKLFKSKYSIKPYLLFKYLNEKSLTNKLNLLGVKFNHTMYGFLYIVFMFISIIITYPIIHILDSNIINNPHYVSVLSMLIVFFYVFLYINIKKSLIKEKLEEDFLRLWHLRFPMIDYKKEEKKIKDISKDILQKVNEGNLKKSNTEMFVKHMFFN